MPILDPRKYIAATQEANQLKETQRLNQNRQDFQQFTPDLTPNFTGVKLGAQPDTRQMIRKNDGSVTTYNPETGMYDGAVTYVSPEEQEKQKSYINPNPENAEKTRDAVKRQMYIQGEQAKAQETFTLGQVLASGEGFAKFNRLPSGLYVRRQPRLFGDSVLNKQAYDAVENNRTKAGIIKYATAKEGDLGPEGVGVYTGKPAPTLKSLLDELNVIKDMADGPIKRSMLEEFKKNLPKELGGNLFIRDNEEKKSEVDSKSVFGSFTDFYGDLATGNLKPREEYDAFSSAESGKKEGEFTEVSKLDYINKEIEAIKASTTPEKIIKAFQNVPTTGANDVVRQAVQKRNEIARLANIAKSEGNREKFEEYKAQLSALDKGIIVAQGMQGLDDLSVGDTRRLSAVMTNATGRNVQIIPQDNGMFNVIGYDDKPKTMSADAIKVAFKPIINKEYAKKIQEIRIEQYKDKYKAGIEINKEIMKQQGELAIEIAKQREIRITELAKDKYKITKDVPGVGANGGLGTLIQKDGNLYRLKDEIKPDPEGKDKLYLNLEPIGDSAAQLGLEGFKQRAGLQQP